ncbi:MAG: hypothetical protein QXK87_03615 [Fervidicoccaceae archaeon]
MSIASLRKERRLKIQATHSLYLTISSYIKPGALHRFTTSLERYDNLMLFVSAYGAIIDEVINFGDLLSRGRKAVGDFPLSIVLSSIKSVMYTYASGLEERLIPPLLLASITDILHYLVKNELGGEQLYIYSSFTNENAREFFEFLKAFDREAKIILNRKGYNESNVSDASLLELINALAYEYLLKAQVSECLSETERRYMNGETLNNTAVSGFISILLNDEKISSNIKSGLLAAMKQGGMKTKEGGKALLEIDRQLQAQGIDTNDNLIPLLKCTNRLLIK